MSTPSTGGPRRRRIAGERRPVSRQVPAPPDEERHEPSVEAERDVPKPKRTRRPSPSRPRTARGRNRRARSASRAGWFGSRASLLTLTGVLVVLAVLVVSLSLGWLGNDSIAEVQRDEAVERASRTAPAAAERAAAAILAYDHRSLEAGKDSALAFMTEDFAQEYADTFDTVVAPAARETKAVVTAEVQASAVVRAGEDRVRVLLFVDQTTESTANPNPQLALNRVEMVMVRGDDDSWLVDEITSY